MEMTREQREQLRRYAPDHLRAIEKIQREAKRQERPAPVAPFTLDFTDLFDQLTVGEAEEIELASGVPALQVLSQLAQGKIAGLAALVWVMRRRDDPKFTLKAARALSLRQLAALLPDANEPEEDEEVPFEASSTPTA